MTWLESEIFGDRVLYLYEQGRRQLKNEPGGHSIEYKGVYTFLKEIHGEFETGIKKFLFYRGARAPGKANVASPLCMRSMGDFVSWSHAHPGEYNVLHVSREG
jgi:hypothetical protein